MKQHNTIDLENSHGNKYYCYSDYTNEKCGDTFQGRTVTRLEDFPRWLKVISGDKIGTTRDDSDFFEKEFPRSVDLIKSIPGVKIEANKISWERPMDGMFIFKLIRHHCGEMRADLLKKTYELMDEYHIGFPKAYYLVGGSEVSKQWVTTPSQNWFLGGRAFIAFSNGKSTIATAGTVGSKYLIFSIEHCPATLLDYLDIANLTATFSKCYLSEYNYKYSRQLMKCTWGPGLRMMYIKSTSSSALFNSGYYKTKSYKYINKMCDDIKSKSKYLARNLRAGTFRNCIHLIKTYTAEEYLTPHFNEKILALKADHDVKIT